VVLMRNAGIPARVVTGFAGGTRNRLGDYWVVRRMDAHAWAEVWLPQRGWVGRPDRAVAPERILDTLDDRLQAGTDTPLQQRWLQLGQMGDWLRRGWNDLVLSFDARRQQQLLKPFGLDDLGRRSWSPASWSPMLAWRGWPGCWPAASASATRCCAPGTGSDGAMRASAWPVNPTKPHRTGHSGYTPAP
jgi:hypothetical protein